MTGRPILTIREQLGKLQATRQSDDGGAGLRGFRSRRKGHRRGTATTINAAPVPLTRARGPE